jgi:hypothetical protein
METVITYVSCYFKFYVNLSCVKNVYIFPVDMYKKKSKSVCFGLGI